MLITLPSGFKYKNLTAGAKEKELTITDYDRTIKVETNSFYSRVWANPQCEDAIVLPGQFEGASRLWNEVLLYSVRIDLARPTVTARNLFHLSILMWDIYSAYYGESPYQYNLKPPEVNDLDEDYKKAISYAAFTFLKARYKDSPGNGDTRPLTDAGVGDGQPDYVLNKSYEKIMLTLGYDTQFENTEDIDDSHARFGVETARFLLNESKNDGSREEENHAAEKNYVLKNPQIVDISQSGLRPALQFDGEDDVFRHAYKFHEKAFGDGYFLPELPVTDNSYLENPQFDINTYVTSPEYELEDLDIDSWMRLNIPGSIDQGGNAQASEQSPLTVFWGRLPTFSDLSKYKSSKPGVYFDPGDQLPIFKQDKRKFIEGNLEVIKFSSLLNPADLKDKDFDRDGKPDVNPGANYIDISPSVLGNNPLGTNEGKGHKLNPITQKPYEKNLVKASDYYRSIAEFWADGPESETPPGHWNTLANYVLDQMQMEGDSLKWRGEGEELSKENYTLRLYLTLNGALHDAAVVAWGIEGHCQGNRPVTVIRYLAKLAEKDPEFAEELVSYAPEHLKMVTYTKHYYDERFKLQSKKVTKLAVKAWRGPRKSGFYSVILMGVVN